MASLKSAGTWARLHVASDERGRVKEGKTHPGLSAPSSAALVILIFLLQCFNTFHHLTSLLDHETQTREEPQKPVSPCLDAMV